MIKKLKRKVLLTIMFFVTLILAAFVFTINYIPVREQLKEAEKFLSMVIDDDTHFSGMPKGDGPDRDGPPPKSEDNMFFMANVATVQLGPQGALLKWHSQRNDLYSQEYLLETCSEVVARNKNFGIVDNSYYMTQPTAKGCTVVFLDGTALFAANRTTLAISCGAAFVLWGVLFFLAVFLVDKMTQPVSAAFEKQRQFISDAGHELKTPISVISANAAVLESEIGHNKWLGYITDETRRMDGLVKRLMSLAAMEDASSKTGYSPFDLSKAVMSICLPFESYAFEKGITIETKVCDGIMYKGSEEKLKQLVSTLLSNGVKYGRENGVIEVQLHKERKKVVLSVYNTGVGVKPDELELIFERFYRTDKSRHRDGVSYGLGLAIAKAVCEEHGGSIKAESVYGSWIKITAELPL